LFLKKEFQGKEWGKPQHKGALITQHCKGIWKPLYRAIKDYLSLGPKEEGKKTFPRFIYSKHPTPKPVIKARCLPTGTPLGYGNPQSFHFPLPKFNGAIV